MITILQDNYTLKMNSTELTIIKNAAAKALELDAEFYEKNPSVKKVLDELIEIRSKKSNASKANC